MRGKGEQLYTEVEGVYKAQTDKALLLNVRGRNVWIPKSQIHGGYTAQTDLDEVIRVDVADWFVNKENLEE